MSECLGAIGQKGGRIPQHNGSAFRWKLAVLLGRDDIELVRRHQCATPVRAGILEAWAASAEDLGIGVVGWLKQGAPACVLESPVLPGTFPTEDVLGGCPSVYAIRCHQETGQRWQRQAALDIRREAVLSQALHEAYSHCAVTTCCGCGIRGSMVVLLYEGDAARCWISWMMCFGTFQQHRQYERFSWDCIVGSFSWNGPWACAGVFSLVVRLRPCIFWGAHKNICGRSIVIDVRQPNLYAVCVFVIDLAVAWTGSLGF